MAHDALERSRVAAYALVTYPHLVVSALPDHMLYPLGGRMRPSTYEWPPCVRAVVEKKSAARLRESIKIGWATYQMELFVFLEMVRERQPLEVIDRWWTTAECAYQAYLGVLGIATARRRDAAVRLLFLLRNHDVTRRTDTELLYACIAPYCDDCGAEAELP